MHIRKLAFMIVRVMIVDTQSRVQSSTYIWYGSSTETTLRGQMSESAATVQCYTISASDRVPSKLLVLQLLVGIGCTSLSSLAAVAAASDVMSIRVASHALSVA